MGYGYYFCLKWLMVEKLTSRDQTLAYERLLVKGKVAFGDSGVGTYV